MAYTELTPQTITKSGLVATYSSADATNGNMWRNSGKEFLHVVNADVSSINVTLTTPATIKGLTIEDKVVAVAAGTDAMIGTFEPGLYNQSAGATDAGKTYVDFSSGTSITVAVIRP